MKKKILLLISFACVIILAINDIYCSKHKNQEEDIIKIEKKYNEIIQNDDLHNNIIVSKCISRNSIRLVWKINEKKEIDEKKLIDLVIQAYITNVYVDTVNLSYYYDIPILNAKLIVAKWNDVSNRENIDRFLKLIIKKIYNIEFTNYKEEFIEQLQKKFMDKFGECESLYYSEDKFNQFIESNIQSKEEWMPYLEMIEYINIYEEYYRYYIQINKALHERNEMIFVDQCKKLYYYVGGMTEYDFLEKYAKKTEEMCNDLKDIVPNMLEMFGGYANGENQYLETAIDASKEIGYSATILNQLENETENYISQEDIEWGTEKFVTHMKGLLIQNDV